MLPHVDLNDDEDVDMRERLDVEMYNISYIETGYLANIFVPHRWQGRGITNTRVTEKVPLREKVVHVETIKNYNKNNLH